MPAPLPLLGPKLDRLLAGELLPAPPLQCICALENTAAFLETLPAFLSPDQASQQRLPDLLEVLRAITTQVEP